MSANFYKGYAVFKDAAFTINTGVINDSIGQVVFAFKSQSVLQAKTLTADPIKSGNSELLNLSKNEPATIDCFYKLLAEKSKYKYKWLANDKKGIDELNTTIPVSAISIYKVEIASNKRVLEVRIKDPVEVLGLTTPVVPLLSVAYAASEKTVISNLINDPNNFVSGKPVYFTYNATPTKISSAGNRDYYEFELKLTGSKMSGTSMVENIVSTGIIIRSVDGKNFFSHNYANEAFPLITGQSWNSLIWNNKTIPETIAGITNPFQIYWSTLQARLQNIIDEANNLPVANTNKGKDLLNQEIRDAIYMGDSGKVTFEMAFRLPFYSLNISAIPYTDNSNNPNNPYYTKFDDWFGYANAVRVLAGLSKLNYAGKTEAEYTTYKDYDASFFTLLGLEAKPLFITGKVGAYIAKNFQYENEFYVNHAHLPFHKNSVVNKGAARDLTQLVNATPAVISAQIKTQLENGTIQYAPVTDGTYKINGVTEAINGGFIFKDPDDGKFYIFNFSWFEPPKNSSGITVGFGYDTGARADYQGFLNYTGLSIPATGMVHDVVSDALGKKKIEAMKRYFPFYKLVWDDLVIPYDTAVVNTPPIMKNDYMKPSIDTLAKNYIKAGAKTTKLLLRTFQPSFTYFYLEGTPQYLNEVEKVFFLSQAYNTGTGSLNPYSTKPYLYGRARRAIHAFNTHDYRYLKYACQQSGIAHKAKIIKLLSILNVYNYLK